MSYQVLFSKKAKKALEKLDKFEAKKIVSYMREVEALDTSFSRGHGLVENKKGLWRYRVDDWRILCEIKEAELIILVVKTGHRKDVYD